MELRDYPDLIANRQIELLAITTKLEAASELFADLTADFDLQVSFDELLKNESQRKAKKVELCRESPDYKNLESSLKALEYQKAKVRIEIEKLVNQFTVLKLIKRGEIIFSQGLCDGD